MSNPGSLRGFSSQAERADARVLAFASLPTAAQGRADDVGWLIRDSADTVTASMYAPKVRGAAWSTAWGPDGETIAVPYRHKSQSASTLMPGWTTQFQDSWMTGTNPTDIYRSAAFGGAFYSTAGGTTVYVGRSKQGTVAMPFFSAECQVTTLPESTRFAWFGQVGYSGGGYGYTARIDSAGAVQLWRMDGVYGNARIGTGTFTVASGDVIVLERFGYRFECGRIASSSRDIVSSFAVNIRNAGASGYDGFAYIYGAQSYGYMTDSGSVRIARLEFSG